MDNPFAPSEACAGEGLSQRNYLARLGLALSLAGVLGLSLVGPFGQTAGKLGVGLSFFSVPGLAVSAVALLGKPRRPAIWGVLVGLFGIMFVPTMWLSLTRG